MISRRTHGPLHKNYLISIYAGNLRQRWALPPEILWEILTMAGLVSLGRRSCFFYLH